MRLPNGYGSVYKMSGNRRKPYRVSKTIGWEIDPVTQRPNQKRVIIGYYETKKAALQALVNYNEDPYDLTSHQLTFDDVYEKWSDEYFETITPSAIRTIKSAYNHSKPLHNMIMRDIKVMHLEQTIANADVGSATKSRMKSLYNMMYKYALKHEIVDKDYAALCNAVKQESPKIERIPFTPSEVAMLFDNLNFPFVDMVLVGIYTGFRPQELTILKVEDLNIENMTIKGGLKTDAGKNRLVPIHPNILPIIESRIAQSMKSKSDYLFNEDNAYLTYDKYRGRFKKVCNMLGTSHKPHDTRHTFITYAKSSGMNEYVLKLIVGHAITDITEKVYTHRTIEQLQSEIKKFRIE